MPISPLLPWVLDTHIWIRLLDGDPALDRPAFLKGIAERSAPGNLVLADISLWETSMLVAKGRLKLSLPVRDWLDHACRMPGLELVAINAAIAAESCSLPGSFHGDPADRLIVATARVMGCALVTFEQAILEWASDGWLHAIVP
jgi:PIN domain nuclease of toxin-antitoxin system